MNVHFVWQTYLEELLVEDESHSTDFLHGSLLTTIVVLEVGSDGQCQLPPQFLPVKARHTTLTGSLSTYNYSNIIVRCIIDTVTIE